jgi:hypothetical protein
VGTALLQDRRTYFYVYDAPDDDGWSHENYFAFIYDTSSSCPAVCGGSRCS